MYNQFTLPLIVHVHPPEWLRYWLYFVHLGILPLLLISGLDRYVVLLVAVLVIYSLYFNLRTHVYQNAKGSILRILVNDENEWWLTMSNGETIQAELLPVNLVHARLTVLGFSYAGQTVYACLTPGPDNQDTLRRLRVRLRFPCTLDELM